MFDPLHPMRGVLTHPVHDLRTAGAIDLWESGLKVAGRLAVIRNAYPCPHRWEPFDRDESAGIALLIRDGELPMSWKPVPPFVTIRVVRCDR